MVDIRRMFRLDGGLWGVGLVIGSALALGAGRAASAQISLQRHTLPGVASPAARMQVPGMTVDFDTSHGGAPLYWYLDPSGYSIIDSFPGRGLSVIYEPGGQDATQAGATGNIDFPIARIGDAPSIQAYNYYARETAFQPPSGSNPNAVYEVTGFGPFFWIS